jgi:aspartate/tyrosine/aromatic aminotransferase
MFSSLSPAPDDPILGLKAAFDREPRPDKINLSAGVYRDGSGRTPVFRSVKLAEARLLEAEDSKDYLPIDGLPFYNADVRALVMGEGHEAVQSGSCLTIQTLGGTGALRVGAELIRKVSPGARVWVSEPTWPNHPGVFAAAGMAVEPYPYFDRERNTLRFDAMLGALESARPGDVVLLHGCCHNPTGIDPAPEQWAQIGDFLARRELVPFVDFAYQGLAGGLEEDAGGTREVLRAGRPGLVASSFSKNFGLYGERAGALTVIAADAAGAQAAASHARQLIRVNYSNPSVHGAALVDAILRDQELRTLWDGEVAAMRERINGMRRLLVEGLRSAGVDRDFSFVANQRGMFSFTGLSKDQVMALRDRHAVYIIDSGRMNVAGITETNVGPLCAAIADILR